MRILLLACLLAASAFAYSPQTTSNGSPLRRTDASNVKFLVNTDGAAKITSGGDTMAALQAAANNWSSIPTSTVRFAPLEMTSAVNDPNDGLNVIEFLDT